MILVVRPVLRWWVRRLQRDGGDGVGLNSLAVLVAILFVCTIVTNLIGVFAVLGAFLLGAILSAERQWKEAVANRLRDLVTVFFVPIFFTYTGLRTNIGTLASAELWLFCGLVLVIAVVGKLGGCGLAAWAGGMAPREAACIGIMMNTRGLVELVVI